MYPPSINGDESSSEDGIWQGNKKIKETVNTCSLLIQFVIIYIYNIYKTTYYMLPVTFKVFSVGMLQV